MIELTTSHVRRLEESIRGGTPPETALPTCIGNTAADGGVWRFFSDTYPPQGIRWWNESSGWVQHWKPFLPTGIFSFGEDVFGNQLVILPGEENVFLWNHEDGALADLLWAPAELLSTVAESGVEWIDFYSNGSIGVARAYTKLPDESHLHWTTPLILGGAVHSDNRSVVERERHLVGHAKLWLQVRGLEPGSTIHIKRPGT